MARSPSTESGFSLIETSVAIGLLTAVAISVAQLFAVTSLANVGAQGSTSTAVLAGQKMEQLRGLTWGLERGDTFARRVSDTTTNLATDPPRRDGRGLRASPATALDQNVPGYVDYLDVDGRWIGTGATPPTGTAFVRRWSIQPLASNPENTIILQVRVVPVNRELRSDDRSRRVRLSDETRLVSVKTRNTL